MNIEERKQELHKIISDAKEELLTLSLQIDKKILLAIINNTLDIDIRRKVRISDYVLGRHIYSKIRYDEGFSYKRIGEELGGYDHSTILKAREKFEDRLIREKKVKDLYNKILKLYKEI